MVESPGCSGSDQPGFSSSIFKKVIYIYTYEVPLVFCTERDELQGDEGPKYLVPPTVFTLDKINLLSPRLRILEGQHVDLGANTRAISTAHSAFLV